MAFNGPPAEEHLLARVRRWIRSAGAFFWPLNNNTERPDADRPEGNRIIDNPPLPPHDEDDENDEGQGGFDRPDSRRGEEREEELNYDDDGSIRAPSPPLQPFPPPNFGMDWRQQAAAFHIPVYYPLPHADPYAFPLVFPYFYPYAWVNVLPRAFPYANPFAFAYAPPYARPYVPPYAPAYAYPFAFAYDPLYVPPYAPPQAAPHAAPPANPPAFLNANPRGAPEQLIARNLREQDPRDDAAGVDEEDGVEIPEPEVFGLGYPETIGPLTPEESLGFFGGESSLEEDAVVPTTSGISSSTRRSREGSSEEESAAKRPRWSDDSDSD